MSNARIAKAIGMMGADTDNESLGAFRMATRMLAAAGLTWRDVAERMTDSTPAPAAAATGSAWESTYADFSDIFNARRAQPQPERREPPKPKREILQGEEIPAEIGGCVTVHMKRAYKGGTMIYVEVRNERATYGPLVAFSDAVRADLERAAAEKLNVIARVRQPNREGGQPVITSVVVIGA